MQLSILCVGKLREKCFREAADEYLKRLRRFGTAEEIEVPDLPEPKNPSPAADAKVMAAEAERLLRAVKPGDFIVALCVEGERMTSPELAARIAALEVRGVSRIVCVIGGSLGLAPEVVARADLKLSLSAMTFPHALARVVLLEQLYRAQKINAGERYHK